MSAGAKTLSCGDFRIEEVGLDSPLLESVIKVHAASKSYLGPFPKGAFEDHARRRMILVAVSPDKIVAGYVLSLRRELVQGKRSVSCCRSSPRSCASQERGA